MTRTIWLLPALAVAALGWRNPVDGVLRGKWVRHWDTRKGASSATLCLPATDPAELALHMERLPEIVEGLLGAGATVVAIDLPMAGQAKVAQRLLALAEGLPIVFPSHHHDGVHSPTPAGAGIEGLGEAHHLAHTAMKVSWPPEAVLGAHGLAEGQEGETVWPMALHTLSLHAQTSLPEWSPEGHISVGPHRFHPTHDYLVFMPYEIPFLHWERPEEWTQAAGKAVFVGACRLDRDLTRFGRQPGVVAHGELFETAIDDVFPRQLPSPVDVLLSGLAGLLAMASRRLLPAGGGIVGPILVGGLGVVGVLLLALQGVWLGLSGIVLAALCGGIAARKG